MPASTATTPLRARGPQRRRRRRRGGHKGPRSPVAGHVDGSQQNTSERRHLIPRVHGDTPRPAHLRLQIQHLSLLKHNVQSVEETVEGVDVIGEFRRRCTAALDEGVAVELPLEGVVRVAAVDGTPRAHHLPLVPVLHVELEVGVSVGDRRQRAVASGGEVHRGDGDDNVLTLQAPQRHLRCLSGNHVLRVCTVLWLREQVRDGLRDEDLTALRVPKHARGDGDVGAVVIEALHDGVPLHPHVAPVKRNSHAETVPQVAVGLATYLQVLRRDQRRSQPVQLLLFLVQHVDLLRPRGGLEPYLQVTRHPRHAHRVCPGDHEGVADGLDLVALPLCDDAPHDAVVHVHRGGHLQRVRRPQTRGAHNVGEHDRAGRRRRGVAHRAHLGAAAMHCDAQRDDDQHQTGAHENDRETVLRPRCRRRLRRAQRGAFNKGVHTDRTRRTFVRNRAERRCAHFAGKAAQDHATTAVEHVLEELSGTAYVITGLEPLVHHVPQHVVVLATDLVGA
eukprot:PhM_4_TR4652/c0_g1_i1/m.87503